MNNKMYLHKMCLIILIFDDLQNRVIIEKMVHPNNV